MALHGILNLSEGQSIYQMNSAISAYSHLNREFEPSSWPGVLDTAL